jgi:hypothetical protein
MEERFKKFMESLDEMPIEDIMLNLHKFITSLDEGQFEELNSIIDKEINTLQVDLNYMDKLGVDVLNVQINADGNDRLSFLERLQEEAILKEDYETAANLRDDIKKIKGE